MYRIKKKENFKNLGIKLDELTVPTPSGDGAKVKDEVVVAVIPREDGNGDSGGMDTVVDVELTLTSDGTVVSTNLDEQPKQIIKPHTTEINVQNQPKPSQKDIPFEDESETKLLKPDELQTKENEKNLEQNEIPLEQNEIPLKQNDKSVSVVPESQSVFPRNNNKKLRASMSHSQSKFFSKEAMTPRTKEPVPLAIKINSNEGILKEDYNKLTELVTKFEQKRLRSLVREPGKNEEVGFYSKIKGFQTKAKVFSKANQQEIQQTMQKNIG